MDEAGPVESRTCANCGASLAGEFCHACGQRRLREADRRTPALLRDALHGLTDLDGRFLRSLRALLLQPGLLSREWIEGRRRRWLAPLTLFLLVNLAYFVVPPLSDLNLTLRDHVTLQPYSAWAHSRVEERLAERGIGFDAYAVQYAAVSGNVSKSMVIWHVPWIALALALCVASRRYTYAEHLVVATHCFSFLLAYALLVNWLLVPALEALPVVREHALALMLALLGGGILAYWLLAFRRAYRMGWWRTLLAGPLLVAGLYVAHYSYRWVQFVVVHALA